MRRLGPRARPAAPARRAAPAQRARPRRWRGRRTDWRRMGLEFRYRARVCGRNSGRGCGPGPRTAPRRDRRPRRACFADRPGVFGAYRRARCLHGRQDGPIPEASRRGDRRGKRQAGRTVTELGCRHPGLPGDGRCLRRRRRVRIDDRRCIDRHERAVAAVDSAVDRRPAAGERRCDGLRNRCGGPGRGWRGHRLTASIYSRP